MNRTSLCPIPLPGATLEVAPAWMEAAQASSCFERLKQEVEWKRAELKIYGKSVLTPRMTAWYGEGNAAYRYSGALHQPLPWTPLLWGLKSEVEAACGAPFNSVLLNYYRDGKDKIGWHSDDEPELGARQ